MPFGAGPHVCPGRELAMKRMTYTVARMLKVFARLENRDPVEEFVPDYRLVTANQNGTKVALFAT